MVEKVKRLKETIKENRGEWESMESWLTKKRFIILDVRECVLQAQQVEYTLYKAECTKEGCDSRDLLISLDRGWCCNCEWTDRLNV